MLVIFSYQQDNFRRRERAGDQTLFFNNDFLYINIILNHWEYNVSIEDKCVRYNGHSFEILSSSNTRQIILKMLPKLV